MRFRRRFLLLAAMLAASGLTHPARADLLISIDKAAQKMTVSVDGAERYVWPVSTGRNGYDTPEGDYKPFRMEKDHFSREWDDAPMPYSIFFTKIGHAIHGTYETRNLGKPASHGCVRLSRAHAATLWDLVKEQKMANTRVVLTGEIPGGAAARVARRQPRNNYGDDGYEAMARRQWQRGWPAYGNGYYYYYPGGQPYGARPYYAPSYRYGW